MSAAVLETEPNPGSDPEHQFRPTVVNAAKRLLSATEVEAVQLLDEHLQALHAALMPHLVAQQVLASEETSKRRAVGITKPGRQAQLYRQEVQVMLPLERVMELVAEVKMSGRHPGKLR